MEQMGNWKRLLSNDHYAIVCVLGRVIAFLTCCYTILLLTLNGIELVMNIPFWNVTALTALLVNTPSSSVYGPQSRQFAR